MKKFVLVVLAFVAFFSIFSRVQAEDDHQHPYNFAPKDGYKSTTPSKYVSASTEQVLDENAKVRNLFGAASNGKTLTQRLTQKSYWVFTGNYNTTFYVGERGVLLLDPLGRGYSENVLKAIKSVTDKPVKMVVYSHSHADHIGGIQVFVDEAKKNSINLDIVSSDATAKKLAFLKSSLPLATKVLNLPKGSIKFEDQTLTVKAFDRPAHTDDSAMWFLEEEGILHVPDYINPDQLPYLGFGVSESYVYFRKNIQAIADAEWKIYSSGHGNVGRKKEVEFMQTYLDDLEAAVKKAEPLVDWGKLIKAQPNNHAALVHSANVELGRITKDLLRSKYGDYYGFEVSVPYQAEMVSGAWLSYK